MMIGQNEKPLLEQRFLSKAGAFVYKYVTIESIPRLQAVFNEKLTGGQNYWIYLQKLRL